MAATVVVVGGGYGGITVATALDAVAHVVLVEPRDRFVHNVAALRGLVDQSWTERLFFPYDRLLERGWVLRDRAVRVESHTVTLASGRELAADYIVLATGSAYPFPAKVDVDDTATAMAKIRRTHQALADANSVLLLGAGPVGLELAGEIKAAWPDMTVTIVDPAADILGGGFTAEFRSELRRQLAGLGVGLALGDSLAKPPPSEPGEPKTFTVATRSGREITADVWFRCFGIVPMTDYLADELSLARRGDGHVQVTDELRLPGQDRVFAIGDMTSVPETKLAKAAMQHAEVVAANIRALINGRTELVTYQAAPPGISLPLGPTGGASYAPEVGVLGAEKTSMLKGADLKTRTYRELFGLTREQDAQHQRTNKRPVGEDKQDP